MCEHIVFVDCDQIHPYLMRSKRLRDIRGASARLSWVNETRTDGLLRTGWPGKHQPLFSAGGVTKAILSSECDAAEFVRQVRRLYSPELPGLQITTHTEPLPDRNRLGEAIEKGEKRVRALKDNKPGPRVVVTLPYFELCHGCGHEPAECPDTHAPGTEKGQEYPLLCPGCLKKRSTRDGDAGWEESPLKAFQDQLCDALRTRCGVAVEMPRDFSEVATGRATPRAPGSDGAEDDPHGTDAYLALLFADANNMGQAVSELQTITEYADFSAAVAQATRNALTEAVVAAFGSGLTRHAAESPNDPFLLPFQPLILGGDDVVCAVMADRALPLAKVLVERFAEGTRGDEAITAVRPTGLTIAAGVAIAKSKYPFHDLYELAGSLCREAKRACRDDRRTEPTRCAVDFLVVSSPRTPDFEELGDLRTCEVGEPKQKMELSGKPYALNDPGAAPTLGGLIEAIQVLKAAEFPRKKLNDLPAIVRQGEEAGKPTYDKWLKALQDGHRQAWLEACGTLGAAGAEGWPTVDGRAFAADLVEIYDYVDGE